jgi:type VI secretion system secreted protein Hcp
MAANMWLKLDGCEGEAMGGGHDKEVEIESFRWGVNHPVSMSKTGGNPGVSSMEYLAIQKKIDKASLTLMKYCLKGEGKDAQLTVRRDDANATDYLKIKMTKAIVADVHPDLSANSPGMETVNLAFEKVEVEYTPPGQGAVTLKWDVLKWAEF